MRLSVVIPAYNAEAFVGEAIESVLSQTRLPDEFFVVDDGSTDGTAAVAGRYAAVTLITQPNGGVAAARNRGIAESEGELIGFHDADDVMHPTKLAMQAAVLEENPGLGCVMVKQEIVHEEGAALPFWSPDSDVPVARIAADSWNNSDDMPGLGGMMITRAAAMATGDFDEELRQAEDLDWLQRATEDGVGITTIIQVLMGRRIHHTNLTQDAAAGRSAMFMMLRKQIERNRSRGPSSSA